MFTLCLQFEPELPEEEEEEPEELENQEEEADLKDVAGQDAVPEDEDAAAAAMPPPPPTGARARDRPPTRRSRFWEKGEDPLSKGLPYTGRPL
jgi:hypothetical protein